MKKWIHSDGWEKGNRKLWDYYHNDQFLMVSAFFVVHIGNGLIHLLK
ncbi:hypothetical protein K8352_04525 [Flavobacteriaceae bacterium F89]|uniref:Uncharacterized protein n=1 Tax=Cerina litoralis TaxID=2874477 RepID=A0AAE3ETV3_9FLAO|nr:hypothetical protein [Cerina litoralis]MCG2459999.1 hypothetical protein [Cerina litoralis]